MAKHPVPKYKTPKRKTRSRYSTFAHNVKVKLEGIVHLVECPNCKEKTLNHHVCKNCGQYRGKKILNMSKKVEKITKVKA